MKKFILLILIGLSSALAQPNLQQPIASDDTAHFDIKPKQSINHLAPIALSKNTDSLTEESRQQAIGITDSDIEKSLITQNWNKLSKDLIIYRKQEQHDAILADFAEAGMWQGKRQPQKAIRLYEKILAKHPDYDFVRLAYAQSLFDDKRYHDADNAFVKINKSKLHPQTAHLVSQYQQAIKRKYKIKIDGGLSYESNDNVNNAATSPTLLVGGLTFKKDEDSRPQKAKGVNYELSINKLLPVYQHHHAEIGAGISGIHYFDQSQYNEEQLRLSVGYVNQNKQHTWKIKPYWEKSWYAEKPYNYTIGLQGQYQYDPSDYWQLRLSGDYAKIKHNQFSDFDTHRSQANITLLYQQPSYYLYSGIGKRKDNAVSPAWDNRRYSFLFGGQYTGQHIGIQTSGSIAKRQFDEKHDYANKRRKDTEYQLRIGLFNPQWTIYDITPIFNWQYNKTDSNIPDLYSKSKQTFFMSFDKHW